VFPITSLEGSNLTKNASVRQVCLLFGRKVPIGAAALGSKQTATVDIRGSWLRGSASAWCQRAPRLLFRADKGKSRDASRLIFSWKCFKMANLTADVRFAEVHPRAASRMNLGRVMFLAWTISSSAFQNSGSKLILVLYPHNLIEYLIADISL